MPKIAAALIERNPDVIVLGEYQVIPSCALVEELTLAGWTHGVFTTPPGRYGGVAIMSKLPFMTRPSPANLQPFAFRYQGVHFPTTGVELRAIYAPLHKDPYAEFWNALLAALKEEAADPVLVVGDFNSGASHVDAPVADFFCSSFFNQLPGCGYSDLWREVHGPDAREYTWLGSVNPYRLDHAFGSSSLAARLVECSYDHSVRDGGLSDHSLLSIKISETP